MDCCHVWVGSRSFRCSLCGAAVRLDPVEVDEAVITDLGSGGLLLGAILDLWEVIYEGLPLADAGRSIRSLTLL